MEDDKYPVTRLLHVEFHHLGAEFDCVPHGRDRVLGKELRALGQAPAAMRHDHHMVAPAVGVLQPLAYLADAAVIGGERRGIRRQCEERCKGGFPHRIASACHKVCAER